jgi:predicted O-methyltransferase YrrM
MKAGVSELLRNRPTIHGDRTHGLIPEALQLIEDSVGAASRTLETGSGFSTITFAGTGAEHTCVVPNQAEVERIRDYCAGAGISLDRVTFYVEPSERVLPTLDTGPLDFVLLDGSHSFPQVFIDWFYVAEPLTVGGTLLVDDIHVWTGAVLRDFLRAEPEWEPVTELRGRTAVFRKAGSVDLDRVWFEQPYVREKTGFGRLPNKARQAVSMIRHGQLHALIRDTRHAARERLR